MKRVLSDNLTHEKNYYGEVHMAIKEQITDR